MKKNNWCANDEFVQITVKEEPTKGVFSAGDTQILEGEVVSSGRKVEFDIGVDRQIERGSKVIFDKFKAIEHSIDGQNYYFVRYQTILAVK